MATAQLSIQTTTDRRTDELVAALAHERTRLVRFCAYLTGDREAAEDLAQETLLEAWRHLTKLAGPAEEAARAKWLTGIARNVCLRWGRQRGHEAARLATLVAADDAEDEANPLDDLAADGTEVEIELERDELAALLDRALALLPPVTRTVLIERYIRELPQAEIAARLRISEDVVAQRLHRGKLTLRTIMTTNLRDEAAAFGLLLRAEHDDWQETRIWCPFCAAHRLHMRQDSSRLAFRCPGSCLAFGGQVVSNEIHQPISAHGFLPEVSGLKSPKPILTRQLLSHHSRYRQALRTGSSSCSRCGAPCLVLTALPPEFATSLPEYHGILIYCPACQEEEDGASLWHLALDTPEMQPFWRQHPRIRALPLREIEVEGSPAFVTSFQSMTDNARFDVVSLRATHDIIGIYNRG